MKSIYRKSTVAGAIIFSMLGISPLAAENTLKGYPCYVIKDKAGNNYELMLKGNDGKWYKSGSNQAQMAGCKPGGVIGTPSAPDGPNGPKKTKKSDRKKASSPLFENSAKPPK